MFAALTYVRLICEYYQITRELTIDLDCDNQGAVDKTQPEIFQFYSGMAACCDNYDLISEVLYNCGQIPGTVRIHWIKGHQDKNTKFDDLSYKAKLNFYAGRCPSNTIL